AAPSSATWRWCSTPISRAPTGGASSRRRSDSAPARLHLADDRVPMCGRQAVEILDRCGLVSHHDRFIDGRDEDFDFARGRADASQGLARGGIGAVVEDDAGPLEAGSDRGANLRRMLADAAAERDRVAAAEHREKGAEV